MYTFLLGKNLARSALIIGIGQIIIAFMFFHVTRKMAEVLMRIELSWSGFQWVQGVIILNIILGLVNCSIAAYLYKNPKKDNMKNSYLKNYLIISSTSVLLLILVFWILNKSIV